MLALISNRREQPNLSIFHIASDRILVIVLNFHTLAMFTKMLLFSQNRHSWEQLGNPLLCHADWDIEDIEDIEDIDDTDDDDSFVNFVLTNDFDDDPFANFVPYTNDIDDDPFADFLSFTKDPVDLYQNDLLAGIHHHGYLRSHPLSPVYHHRSRKFRKAWSQFKDSPSKLIRWIARMKQQYFHRRSTSHPKLPPQKWTPPGGRRLPPSWKAPSKNLWTILEEDEDSS